MLKIVRPVSLLLLSATLCSGGTAHASDSTATSKVDISQQQKSLKGTVNDDFGPVANGGHVFNLGHGINQFTPPESVGILVDEVHRYSASFHR